MPPTTDRQYVIVYDRHGQTKVWDTAYTPEQVREGIRNCVRHRSTFANVRAVLAYDHMRDATR